MLGRADVMSRLLFALLGASVAIGCARSTAPRFDNPSLATLRSAPTFAQVGSQTLILSAHLWRDFEPPVPPGGGPLTAVFVVSTSDTASMPAVEADIGWLVNGTEVWRAVLENSELADPYPNTILKFAYNGPKWAPGTLVDVIVRVRDASGETYLIRAPNRPVESAH